MIFPEKEQLKEIVGKYDRIIFYKEIAGDIFTPVGVLKNFSQMSNLFLFESAKIDKTFSRYSFFSFYSENVKLFRGNNRENPVEYLENNIKNEKVFYKEEFGDFTGGFVGFLGYECVNYMNILRKKIKESADDIIAGFMEINKFYIFDNFTNKTFAACSLKSDFNYSSLFFKAVTILEKMTEYFFKKNELFLLSEFSEGAIVREYSNKEFIEKVMEIKSEIIRGETIQTVFSQKYEVNGKINPVSLYRAIRNINPSPYLFFLKFNDIVLLGSSPETHLKIKDRVATLKPIAGTYPVSENLEILKNRLIKDEKEVSEHLMLLDLARNDLYQGCKIGSVEVVKAFTTEVYSHVIHIVSEVKGELKDDIESFNLFIKTFPAGTVTGAPKVRAMELIDKYEKSTRGFYAGCVGYFSYNGNIDTCITIRSALITRDKVIFRAGAGIVNDSIPEKELYEVEKKLGAMFNALKLINNLEEKNVFVN